jgi:hypothetical protein
MKWSKKFDYYEQTSQYHCNIIKRLIGLSSQKMLEFTSNRSSTLKAHPIKWDEGRVSEKSFGIPNEAQIASNPYQFSISKNKDGRVHGFIIQNVFFIVWLDPEHNLYPNKK